MTQELIRYATGEVVPTRADRSVARQAQQVYDDVRLRSLQADGVAALAGRIMEDMTKLDEKRKSLCHPEDEHLNNILGTIELEALNQMQRIQQGCKPSARPDPWRFG